MDEPTSCGGPSMNRASSSTSSCIAAVTQGGGDNFLATVAKGDAIRSPGEHHRQTQELWRPILMSLRWRSTTANTRASNNRAENSHQPTRQRERAMRRFKSAEHA